MSEQTLRVVWPIVNDALFDDEAIVEAIQQWPEFVHRHRVEITDSPRIRVVDLDDTDLTDLQKQALRPATRVVVCEAPAVPLALMEAA